MKKSIFLLFALFLISNSLSADQLAYISKADAEKAAALIKGKTIILFCGCCTDDEAVKVKILKTEVKYTGYEDYYEVIITYKNIEGDEITVAIDLAYVWMKYKKTTQTVGKALNLEHDPCSEPISWKQ
jgi:hypothetical protein